MRAEAAAFRRLEPDDRRLLLRALLGLPAVALALRLLGFRRVSAWAGRPPNVPPEGLLQSERAERTAQLVALAARRGPFRATCLPAALTLQALLRRQGISGDLRFGVRRQQDGIAGHAWVEHEGVALTSLDDPPGGYPPLQAPADQR